MSGARASSVSVAVAVALLLVTGASAARGEDLAVLIVPALAKDAPLADNLTEVAMARMARTPGHALVGTLELRRRAGDAGVRNLQTCMEQPACLGSVGASLGVGRLITGVVSTRGSTFLISIALTDVASRKVENRVFRQVEGSLPELIRAVQTGIDELLEPRPEAGHLRVESQPEGARVVVDDVAVGTTPLLSRALQPGTYQLRVELDRRFPFKSAVKIPPGQTVRITLAPEHLPPRRTWAPYLAYGSGIAASACFVGGGIFGSLGEIEPSGSTREEAWMDFRRRQTYGNLGTALLATGAVLTLVSAVTFVKYWRHIASE